MLLTVNLFLQCSKQRSIPTSISRGGGGGGLKI